MSFVLPKSNKGLAYGANCSPRANHLVCGDDDSKMDTSLVEMNKKIQREELRNELIQTIENQVIRIQKLKNETFGELENDGSIRISKLEERLNSAWNDVRLLLPKVEAMRDEFEKAKEQNRGFEMQFGTMRSTKEQTLANIAALKEQTEQSNRESKNILTEIELMTEHVARIGSDKATMQEKMKRALECVVIDESLLNSRLAEEQRYNNELANALNIMQSEYMDNQQYNRAELAPLENDISFLTDHLEKTRERTKDALRNYFDVEQRANNLEVAWINDLQVVGEALEKANALYRLKATVVAMLEGHIRNIPDNIKPKKRNSINDEKWLTCYLDVWNLIVREVASEKIKNQREEEINNQVDITSKQLQATKNELLRLKKKVQGDGSDRVMLLHQIRNLNLLESQKKLSEEDYIRDVTQCAAILNEDVPKILYYIQKDSYDDYVSSTDEDEEEYCDGRYPVLEEEGNADIAAIISSYELDPEDPESIEIIERNIHRPKGPLEQYSKMKREYLRLVNDSSPKRPLINRRPHHELKETLERVVLPVQEKIVNKLISDIKTRKMHVPQWELDPKNEEMMITGSHSRHAEELSMRIERWVTQQKENSMKFKDGMCEALLSCNAPIDVPKMIAPPKTQDRIIIKDAHVPREIECGTPITKAVYFLNLAVKGVRLMLFPKDTLQPQLRHVFLSRDLTRVIARRVSVGLLTDNIPVSMGDDADIWVKVQDVFTILLGHRSDVFRDAKLVSKTFMSEDLAFSLMSHSRKSIDLECNSMWDRNMWANVMAFVINESRNDGPMEHRGIITKLVRERKIAVVDVINRSPDLVEISERSNLQVIVN